MSKRPIERIAASVSIVSFFGSILFGGLRAISTAGNQPIQSQTASAATTPSQDRSRQSQFKAQEQEYEVVLNKEPDNQVALEGLIETRLRMKDTKGAVKPLQKLIGLYPDRQEYKTLLVQVKKKVDETK